MSVADKRGSGAVEIDELGTAAGTWMALRQDQEFIDEKMELYDTDKSGALDRPQLKNMMKDLNEGEEPDAAQVDEVLRIADTSHSGEVNRWEVRRAVEEWYAYAAIANDQRKVKEESKKKREGGGRGWRRVCTCTIS